MDRNAGGTSPTISQITNATVVAPYYSLILAIGPVAVEALVQKMNDAPTVSGGQVQVDETEDDVAEGARRLMTLNDRPVAREVLQDQILRETHDRLLADKHGPALRALDVADSHAQRVARAVGIIRSSFAEPLRVEQLAAAAGMSQSSIHPECP